jgi:hypothetical protein
MAGRAPLASGLVPRLRRRWDAKDRRSQDMLCDLLQRPPCADGDQQIRSKRVDLGSLEAAAGARQEPARVDDQTIRIRPLRQTACAFDQARPVNRAGIPGGSNS